MIKRHQLVNPHFAEILRKEFETDIAEDGLPVLEKNSWELGSFMGTFLENAAIGAALGATKADVYQDLSDASAFGTTHFRLASGLSKGEELDVRGKMHRLPANKSSSFTAISYWILSMRASIIIRNANGVKHLVLSASDLYGHDFEKLTGLERIEGSFYRAVVEQNSNHAIALASQLLESAPKSDYSQMLKMPELEFWTAILQKDLSASSERLQHALMQHKAFWGSSENQTNANGWISLPLLHACAYAYDHGMDINVESDYIPRWLVTGDFERIDLT